MSLPATLPAPILETILASLAALFLTGAGGDPAAARQSAFQMLAAYHPRTEDELRLAASIIGFSFHALEALGKAAEPGLSLARILRLRGNAVSLSRESAKAERRLAQLQKAPQPVIPTQTVEISSTAVLANTPAKDTGKIAATAKASGVTWTQAYNERQRERRIEASLRKADARMAAQVTPAIPAPAPDHGIVGQASP